MNAAPHPSRALAVWAALLAACVVGGGGLVWAAERALASDMRLLRAAKGERKTLQQRLAHLAREERDLRGHRAIWNRLTELGIVGDERRLEWLDALARIRAAHGLHDLRYQIESQRPWRTSGEPSQATVRSSTLSVEATVLHEGELLRFLDDLRNLGNAYPVVRRCSIQRTAVSAGPPAAAGLRGKCGIDLITIAEDKGKK